MSSLLVEIFCWYAVLYIIMVRFFLLCFAESISENPLSLLGQYSDDEEDDEAGSIEPSKSPDQHVISAFYEKCTFNLYCHMNFDKDKLVLGIRIKKSC